MVVLASFVLSAAQAQPFSGTALVRHAPTLNGNVEGSIHQMTAENATLNGGARVTGDLFVPGTPTVRLNGSPAYGGTQDGTGSATPTNRTITLNGGASLGHVVRRTDAIALPAVAAPPPPTGTRSVSLNKSGQSPGDFSTLKNLTLNSNVGQIVVPPGTYGNFNANSGSGFVLGVAGATTPAVYNFQNLTLNSNSGFTVVGPVEVTVDGGFSTNTTMGAPGHPGWLKLRIAGGGLSLASNRIVYAHLEAPDGTLTLNGGSKLIGAVTADRLIVNGNSLLQLVASAPVNQPPTVALTAPANGASFTAPVGFSLVATATDNDGSIAKVEFYRDAAKLGEDALAPYEFAVSGLAAGTHHFLARAVDNGGLAADSTAITVTVTAPNVPPTVTLTAPAAGASYTVPATIHLAATASDSDGTVAKVEFFDGDTQLGEDTAAPFEFDWTLIAAGSHVLMAKATDNTGLSMLSDPVTVAVTDNGVPFLANFEPAEGYQPGPLPGQRGWIVDGSASIVTSPVYAGLQAVSVAPATPPALLVRAFVNSDPSVTFVDFFAQPAAGSTPAKGVFFETEATRVALTGTGPSGNLQVFSGDGVGGGTWLPTGEGPALDTSGHVADWLRLTARADYTGKTWDLYFNGRMIAANLGFIDNTQPAFTSLGLSGHATLATGFDDLLVGFENPLFADADHDGMDDAWETAHGLNPALNDRDGDLDQDGLGNVQEFLLTTKPDNPDTDGDSAPDALEVAFGHNPIVADAVSALETDTDGDGLTLAQELLLGTDPETPDQLGDADSDEDGLPDLWELKHGTNTRQPETLAEINSDVDGDGLNLFQEAQAGTSPTNPDTDGDGLRDDYEVRHGLDPLAIDSALDPDGDGRSNLEEFRRGTDPDDYYNGMAHEILPFIGGEFDLGARGLLAVRVTDTAGNPLINAPVVLELQEGDAQIALTPDGPVVGRQVEIRTGPGGIARAYLKAP